MWRSSRRLHLVKTWRPKAVKSKRAISCSRRGTRLDPPAVAVAATVGKTRLEVGPRPKVAVIATGDELVAPSQIPGPGQIRNSNGFSLVAQCRAAGAAVSYLGVARDDEASLEALIREGLDFDVPASFRRRFHGPLRSRRKSARDLRRSLLVRRRFVEARETAGFRAPRWYAGIRTSWKPRFDDGHFPSFSCEPRWRASKAPEDPTRALLRATLEKKLANRGVRRAFIPGWVRTGESGELHAFPIATRGSGDVVAFSKSNALLIVPEDIDKLEAGEDVRFYPLDSFLIKEDIWQAGRNPS